MVISLMDLIIFAQMSYSNFIWNGTNKGKKTHISMDLIIEFWLRLTYSLRSLNHFNKLGRGML